MSAKKTVGLLAVGAAAGLLVAHTDIRNINGRPTLDVGSGTIEMSIPGFKGNSGYARHIDASSLRHIEQLRREAEASRATSKPRTQRMAQFVRQDAVNDPTSYKAPAPARQVAQTPAPQQQWRQVNTDPVQQAYAANTQASQPENTQPQRVIIVRQQAAPKKRSAFGSFLRRVVAPNLVGVGTQVAFSQLGNWEARQAPRYGCTQTYNNHSNVKYGPGSSEQSSGGSSGSSCGWQ